MRVQLNHLVLNGVLVRRQFVVFAFDVGQLTLETLSILCACLSGAVVHSGQVCFQNGRTVRAEDPVAEEAPDGVQELVFADTDRGGQVGVGIGTAAEQVGAFGLRVRIDGPVCS
ncbi:hypothetical protein [Amycolatopsis sp. NPDC051071]|uniref:hypothetical protein n=1 Tax=Amycolatopsis sp. NPDC051071 TaxID=3154637 RepID=UPI003449CFE8